MSFHSVVMDIRIVMELRFSPTVANPANDKPGNDTQWEEGGHKNGIGHLTALYFTGGTD